MLQRLAPRKSGFDIVPPFKPIAFIGFPAEQDYSSVAHGRKIDETLLVVFQLNPQALQLSRVR